ncbi:hypothetical protein C900_04363 [Fulvivirga imtechensis AK7]|uniref:Uncharacterized protein n=1 Tax=Fulvivirga imtechensis AK7 TaxID=1237149 RepID=L8JWS2_9BACT|nr:hypothetical protein C900_04363 [Fulvivirga imtechensis AK7]
MKIRNPLAIGTTQASAYASDQEILNIFSAALRKFQDDVV